MAPQATLPGFNAWIEQNTSIHAKACSPAGDPLELSADQARAIASILRSLASELDRLDHTEDAPPAVRPSDQHITSEQVIAAASRDALPAVADDEIHRIEFSRGIARVHLEGPYHGVRTITIRGSIGLIDFGSIGEDLSHLEWVAPRAFHTRLTESDHGEAQAALAFVSAWTGESVLEIPLDSSATIHLDGPP